jgi:hypothetical protein
MNDGIQSGDFLERMHRPPRIGRTAREALKKAAGCSAINGGQENG